MKKTIKPAATPPSWDPEALYLKAGRYVQHMSALDSDDWEYALWSSLSLEFLARAALANVSPALRSIQSKMPNSRSRVACRCVIGVLLLSSDTDSTRGDAALLILYAPAMRRIGLPD